MLRYVRAICRENTKPIATANLLFVGPLVCSSFVAGVDWVQKVRLYRILAKLVKSTEPQRSCYRTKFLTRTDNEGPNVE
jgi:hypothetical protein